MNTPDGFSSAELIYAFLDGQSTEAENHQLFTDLSTDPELQQELREALQLSAMMTKEARLAPPVPVVNSLMQAAGFTSAIVATQATSGAVTKGVAAGAAALFLGKRAFDRALFFVLGVVAATGALLVSFNDRETTQAQAIPSEVKLHGEVITQGITSNTTTNTDKAGEPSIPEATSTPSQNSTSHSTGRVYKERSFNNTVVNRAKADESVSNVNAITESERVSDLATETTDRQERNVASTPDTTTSKEVVKNTVAESSRSQQTGLQEIKQNDLTEPGRQQALERLELGLYGAANLRLFPNREFTQTGTMPAMSVELLWNVDEHHAFGLEAGNEIFPIYVLNADAEYELRESMAWAGIAYRAFFIARESGSFTPYITASTGWTSSGILVKSGLGISWLPEQTITFMIEPQWTSLIYRDRGNVHATHKIGFNYGMSYKF